jgi:ketosteroid isomerase-like protein
MSQENVEIVRRAMAARWDHSQPDFETVNALYHADHVLTTDWGAVERKTYRGARGHGEATADMNAAWQDWRQEVERVLDAGENGVVVLVRLRARGRESGAPVDRRWAMVVKLRDGKIAASHAFIEPSDALKAVGLEG